MINLTATSPKKHASAIVLCVDDEFAPYAFALITQLVNHFPDLDADFCLVSETPISPPTTLASLPIRYCQVAIAKGDVRFPLSPSLTFATYLRLFAITALAEDYRRVIYMDGDFFYASGDVSALLTLDLRPGHAVGAVRDMPQQKNVDSRPNEAIILGLPHFPYFNAGLMVVDTREWLAQDILARSLTVVIDKPEAVAHRHGQTAINVALRGQWSELSYIWNFMYTRQLHLPMRVLRPVFIHFVGFGKPWLRDPPYVPVEAVRWYKMFLATHYPDLVPSRYNQQYPLRNFHTLRLIKPGLRAMRRRWRYFQRLMRSPDTTIDPHHAKNTKNDRLGG
ncbi:MAG: glycosyltransferase [Pseudomonadota bacterium]